jgi:ABC-2 type transport system permease protein
MNDIRLLGRYLSVGMAAQLQYPAGALFLAFGQFCATIADVTTVWVLFSRFGAIHGWRFGDAAMFFGMISISFALADFMSRGFDVLGVQFLRTGDFDRLLLRPRSLTVQLMGHDFRLSRMGRLAQGVVVVAIAGASLHLEWGMRNVALALWTIAGGVALFFGLLVIQGAISFWTIESLEAMNLLTYGGVHAAQFPLSLYARWFRDFLTFVVPIGCVAYYPVLAILGKHDPLGAPDWVLPFTPLAGFVFCGLSFLAWRAGVAKYTSTGS